MFGKKKFSSASDSNPGKQCYIFWNTNHYTTRARAVQQFNYYHAITTPPEFIEQSIGRTTGVSRKWTRNPISGILKCSHSLIYSKTYFKTISTCEHMYFLAWSKCFGKSSYWDIIISNHRSLVIHIPINRTFLSPLCEGHLPPLFS